MQQKCPWEADLWQTADALHKSHSCPSRTFVPFSLLWIAVAYGKQGRNALWLILDILVPYLNCFLEPPFICEFITENTRYKENSGDDVSTIPTSVFCTYTVVFPSLQMPGKSSKLCMLFAQGFLFCASNEKCSQGRQDQEPLNKGEMMPKIADPQVVIRAIWRKWSDLLEKRVYRSNNEVRNGGWMLLEFVLENWNVSKWDQEGLSIFSCCSNLQSCES